MDYQKTNLQKYEALDNLLLEKLKDVEAKALTGGLLCISIDNMPMIISSQGSAEAENIVDDLIKYLKKILSQTDIVVRTAQNQINIILTNCSKDEMREKALFIRKEIQGYGCKHRIKPIQIMSAIGGVSFVAGDKNVADIINKAYIAANEAKEKCRYYIEYGNGEKHERESKNQMILATYLQNALLKNRLTLAFQPIINAKTGDEAYYECLLRIINDDTSVSSAGPFIPIAEQMGFIDVIDSLVLQLVINELRSSKNVKLALNVSQASMRDSNWLDMAIKLLDDPDIASRFIVEITETAEADNQRNVTNFITTLQSLGCEVALDDFGTGYTSFSQLKSLPVDIIKIDGSFVKDINHNAENKFFVKTLLDISGSFGLKTVAEYVENGDTAKTLVDMNVDFMQGNYFSPAVNYKDWLAERHQ